MEGGEESGRGGKRGGWDGEGAGYGLGGGGRRKDEEEGSVSDLVGINHERLCVRVPFALRPFQFR